MKPTIAFLSYSKLTAFIKKVEEHYLNKVNIIIIDAVLEEALEKAMAMEREGRVSVFVSAGGNARLLSKNLRTSFVEIKVTGFDVLLALKRAKKYAEEIAIVSYKNKIPYLDELKDIINVTLREVTYNHAAEIGLVMESLKNDGCNTVVGASLVTEEAQKKGLHGVFIYSLDGVTRAMDTATNIALSKQKNWEKAERLRIITDFAYGGIIAADKNGIVEIYSPSAEKIVGLPRQKVIGNQVETIFGNSKLAQVMAKKEPQLNQVESIDGMEVLINKIPIIVGNEVTGAVATFQSVDTIAKAEEKIRRKLHEKGFLAGTHLKDIIGNSKALQKAKNMARLYAKNDSTVLILGESGTGKELFAQAIHNASARSQRPFVAINCSALTDSLLESELFGYEEGAFTGARKGGKPGIFELAHRGTIFLDEIGGISPKLQSRLLRVIEEREVMRIGGDRIIPVNIRIIAATNEDLWQKVEGTEFRKDLYYRINVLELALPPLRDRKEDIPALVHYFLLKDNINLNKEEINLVTNRLQSAPYDWLGNVRELANIVERFGVLYDREIDQIPALIESLLGQKNNPGSIGQNDEISLIEQVLKEVGGNKTEAARKLGISRTTLWRRLRDQTSSS